MSPRSIGVTFYDGASSDSPSGDAIAEYDTRFFDPLEDEEYIACGQVGGRPTGANENPPEHTVPLGEESTPMGLGFLRRASDLSSIRRIPRAAYDIEIIELIRQRSPRLLERYRNHTKE
ncbi:unnamed protein product [Phytophthora fragariaefolia]|uniref:Unnamed protein product n=1 Tax=Phytophthora fragariaefolia TaxID=1490495 RepID=A0A9W6TVG5_9STRA|nr:unnamed protein product [Phytophthora fragariaefolia]